jgi:hypothetical protein
MQPAQLPPQSADDSLPLRTPSEQLGAWQNPPLHTPLAQSLLLPQASPAAHAAQAPPPQSVSLSAPFSTPSLQLPAWQTPAVHTPLAQSLGPAQL